MQKQNSEGFTEMRGRYRNADGVEVGGDWGGAVVKVRGIALLPFEHPPCNSMSPPPSD